MGRNTQIKRGHRRFHLIISLCSIVRELESAGLDWIKWAPYFLSALDLSLGWNGREKYVRACVRVRWVSECIGADNRDVSFLLDPGRRSKGNRGEGKPIKRITAVFFSLFFCPMNERERSARIDPFVIQEVPGTYVCAYIVCECSYLFRMEILSRYFAEHMKQRYSTLQY